MNAREREVMVAALENCLSLRNAHPYSQTEAAAFSDAFLRDYGSQLLAILRAPDALIADTRAGEGVEAVAEVRGDPAPANGLPSWDECKQRVENSDFLADREANGGYGAEHDSKVASELHRFIYEYDDASHYRSGWFLHRLELVLEEARHPQPAQGGQGQQEAVAPEETVIATSDRDLFDRLRRSQRWCELASHDGNDEFAGLAYDLREAAAFVESAQSQTPQKEQGKSISEWIEEARNLISNFAYEMAEQASCEDDEDNGVRDAENLLNEHFAKLESTRAPQPHMTDAHAAKLEGLREASLRGIENDPFKD